MAHAGQFVLLEAALPTREPKTAGVLLYDPSMGRLGRRLRRDWSRIADPQDAEILAALPADLERQIEEVGGEAVLARMEDSLSNALRISERRPVEIDDFGATLNRLYREHVPATVIPFETHLPLYSLKAAAGRFGELQTVEPSGWLEAPEGMRLADSMFVARVVGRSMQPQIPDGSLCVFRAGVVGSRQGKRVLVENFAESEEGGQRYTVKRYRSHKVERRDGLLEHEWIRLEPLNPDFEAWELREGHDCRLLAEFVAVVD